VRAAGKAVEIDGRDGPAFAARSDYGNRVDHASPGLCE
jgi:hypothetical protein